MERFWRALGFDYTRRVHIKRMVTGTDWMFWLGVLGVIVAAVLALRYLG
ncbi:hypothetical protein [Sphingosinicella sp. BN140058]|nr:hypothetical protein [Sphingosinicella sp. BN140058]